MLYYPWNSKRSRGSISGTSESKTKHQMLLVHNLGNYIRVRVTRSQELVAKTNSNTRIFYCFTVWSRGRARILTTNRTEFGYCSVSSVKDCYHLMPIFIGIQVPCFHSDTNMEHRVWKFELRVCLHSQRHLGLTKSLWLVVYINHGQENIS